MAKKTRSELVALITANILTGGRRTTAAKVRELVDAVVESLANIPDDANANDGYLKINSSGRVDITKINSATPSGELLSDAGTWVAPKLKQIVSSFATITSSGTSETDLLRSGISAGLLSGNGDRLDFKYGLTLVYAAAESGTVRIYFDATGASLLFNTTGLSGSSTDTDLVITGQIIRVSATEVRWNLSMIFDSVTWTQTPYKFTGAGSVTGLTLSASTELKITGQQSGAATDRVQLKTATIDYVKAP